MGKVLVVLAGASAWAGFTLLLSTTRWSRHRSLRAQLAPYTPGSMAEDRTGVLSASSFRDVVGPFAVRAGTRLTGLLGVNDETATRLRLINSPLDVPGFRLRQLAGSLVGVTVALAVVPLLGLPVAVTLAMVLAVPAIVFLGFEQHLESQAAAWRARVMLELPVVAEQLGMLLSAGYSLGSAIHRLAERGAGNSGIELRRVWQRTQHGVAEAQALREWAALTDLDALDRLCAILALNRDTADLGRLITEEARAVRRDVHRQTLELIERRGQQVWIPVTVATLIPGVLLLAIPFFDALQGVTG